MPCHCCNGPLHGLHTSEGRHGQSVHWDDISYSQETFPGVWVRYTYCSMQDWELDIARRQWPNNPFLYIEYARRTPGHLEGSSRDGELLDREPFLRKFLCSDEGPGEDASIAGKSKESVAMTCEHFEGEHISEGNKLGKVRSPSPIQQRGSSKRSFSKISSPERDPSEVQADPEIITVDHAMSDIEQCKTFPDDTRLIRARLLI